MCIRVESPVAVVLLLVAAIALACTLHVDPPEVIPECSRACLIDAYKPTKTCYCRMADAGTE